MVLVDNSFMFLYYLCYFVWEVLFNFCFMIFELVCFGNKMVFDYVVEIKSYFLLFVMIKGFCLNNGSVSILKYFFFLGKLFF